MKGDQNGCGTNFSTPYLLSRLTFTDIEREIERFPALVLPLGGCEPFGPGAALGLASVCSEALASHLSRRHSMLMAPTLPYGCSTPYSAFGGATGVNPRTLTNMLCEILRRFRRQGIGLVLIIDPLLDNGPALDEAMNRLKNWDRNLHIVPFGIQRDERVKAFVGNRCPIEEPGRSEFAMLSLAAGIDSRLVRGDVAGEKQKRVGIEERYRKWRRRGGDPQQFRSFFPGGSTSTGATPYDPEIGRELFDYILALIEETITPLFPSLGSEY